MRARWVASALILGGCMLLSGGCERQHEPEEYLARVNNEYLTIDMIQRKFEQIHGVNEALVREYVNQWLTSEILFQEARRRGLDRDERVLAPLQDVRRHLAINALLEDEVYAEIFDDISEEEVRGYFETHREEFILNEPLVEISYVLFEQRSAATTFRNAVVQGTTWEVALENILTDPERAAGVIEVGERGYYKERELYPAEIWRAARQLGQGGVSFPVSTSLGFYIIRHHRTIQGGEPYPLGYVSNEIRERLVIKRRQERYEEFLLELRERYPIEISFDGQFFDTVTRE